MKSQANLIIVIALMLFCPILASSQNIDRSGWFFFSHQQKVSEKWSYMADFQLRYGLKNNYLKNILVRPGLIYNINDQHSVGLGYTYFGSWDKSELPHTYEPENRIFEQYSLKTKTGRLTLNNRFRLEQRFIQKTDGNVYAQRFRHQIQARIRLNADTAFKKGFYLNLQNEVFLNVQNKGDINNKLFDQNRPYLGFGYRIHKKIETELGYYYLYQINADSRSRDHIFQLMIVTDL